MTRGVEFVDTMSSGSRYKAQRRQILPLDIASTAPTPVVFHEPMSRLVESYIINDLMVRRFIYNKIPTAVLR